MDEHPSSISEDGDMSNIMENSNGKEITTEESSVIEPFVGMEFESEEAAKVFYDAYATHLGFIMRVDAFRRSMRDGKVVWRRLVCNKEGFRKLRPRRSENRKPRAITREGCKAMIVVKKEKTGKWVATRFVKDHNHPLVAIPSNGRRSVLLSQTPDEKDVKIRELTAELQRERKRSAAYQEQLDIVLRDMEDHSHRLSRNIEDIVQSVREIESKRMILYFAMRKFEWNLLILLMEMFSLFVLFALLL
ncbi:protein FAR1-RELATED SEQUENCE 1 [Euphorbia lathyris]|uniref:protein FAR1-RELATED SEQUENCE 1 n=1 Tax=Euphorbia lathyris TaxID=212925 RepID=UPI003314110B